MNVTALIAAVALVSAVAPAYADTLEELQGYALELVNGERISRDLAPLEMSDTPSAQVRAEDMLENDYMAHWNSDGYEPWEVYLRAGGQGGVLENVAYSSSCNGTCLRDAVRKMTHDMMYDDAHANWGHRHAILDQDTTHANFGIAWEGNVVRFAQHFEVIELEWDEVFMDDGWLYLKGPQANYIEYIGVWRADVPEPLPNLSTKEIGEPVRWYRLWEGIPHGEYACERDCKYGMFVERYAADGDTIIWFDVSWIDDPDSIHSFGVYDTEGDASFHVMEFMEMRR